MNKLIIKVGLAIAVLFAFVGASAVPAQAAVSTGNVVWNYGRDFDVSAQYYQGTWFDMYHNYSQSKTKCVKPRVYMVSQWGGGYAAGVIRCFETPNNTLKLYRFGEGPA